MAPPPQNPTSEVVAIYVTHLSIATGNNTLSPTNAAVPLGILHKEAGSPAPDHQTTKKPDNVVGYFGTYYFSPYTCAGSSVAVTDRSGGVACTTAGDSAIYSTTCYNQGELPSFDCNHGGMCCSSESPHCVKLFWMDLTTQHMFYCAMSAATTYLLDSQQPLDTPAPVSTTSTDSSSSQSHPIPSKTTGAPASTSTSSSALISTDAANLIPGFNMTTSPTSTGTGTPLSISPNNDTSGLSTAAKAGIGAGTAVGALALLLVIIGYCFKKRRNREADQHLQDPNSNNSRGLQDHPDGSLPASIAPPARDHHRASSLGWRSQRSQTESDIIVDMGAGASEVPVNMRGQAPGAFELDASASAGQLPVGVYELHATPKPVEMPPDANGAYPPRVYQAYQPPMPAELQGSPGRRAPIGIDQDQYTAYQSQAAHPRYSQASGSVGPEAPYRGPAPAATARPELEHRKSDDDM